MNKCKENSYKYGDINPIISLNTSNTNGLNVPIKRDWQSGK